MLLFPHNCMDSPGLLGRPGILGWQIAALHEIWMSCSWSDYSIKSRDDSYGRPKMQGNSMALWHGYALCITGPLWGESITAALEGQLHQRYAMARQRSRKILWHHDIKTLTALLTLCEGNPPVTSGFYHKGPIMRKLFALWRIHQ